MLSYNLSKHKLTEQVKLIVLKVIFSKTFLLLNRERLLSIILNKLKQT